KDFLQGAFHLLKLNQIEYGRFRKRHQAIAIVLTLVGKRARQQKDSGKRLETLWVTALQAFAQRIGISPLEDARISRRPLTPPRHGLNRIRSPPKRCPGKLPLHVQRNRKENRQAARLPARVATADPFMVRYAAPDTAEPVSEDECVPVMRACSLGCGGAS